MREKRCCIWQTVLIYGFAGFLLSGGCGDKGSGLSDAELDRIAITEKIKVAEKAGNLVLVVGGDTVTSDEIIEAPANWAGEGKTIADLLMPLAEDISEEEFKGQARIPLKDIVIGKISSILLYQHAKRELGSGAKEALDQMAEKELRKFVLRYHGDEAKADEALREMGMDREQFKEEHKRTLITQSYLASKLPYKKPVIYSELVEYYEKHKEELFSSPGLLKFRLIDIDISKVEVTDIEQNRLEKARKLAAELAERAAKGEDFARLAEEHSHGHRRVFGGLWPEIQPDSLAKPYVVLAERAEDMKPGEITGPAETVGHIFIMKLEAKQKAGYKPLEQVQGRIHEAILRERRNEALTRLNERLLREAQIGRTDDFVDFCVDQIYAMSKEPAGIQQESK